MKTCKIKNKSIKVILLWLRNRGGHVDKLKNTALTQCRLFLKERSPGRCDRTYLNCCN